MKKKTIVVAAGVIGLIGLGLLIHYLHKESVDTLDYVPAKPGQPVKPNAPNKSSVHKTTNAVSKPVQPRPPAPLKQNPVQAKPVTETKAEKVSVPVVEQPKVEVPLGDDFPLQLGSQGPRVERLQVYLMRNFGRTGKVTGIFDEQTQGQVKKRFHTTLLDEKTYQKFRMGKHVNEQVIIR